MWRSKKFIIIALLAMVVLVGSIGGVAFAQTEDGDGSHPEPRCEALMDRVGEIYKDKTGDALDQEALKGAFAQAGAEMRAAAMENRLQYLVDEGKITQDEADQYLEWRESSPDMPDGFGFGGRGGFRGMGGMPGFRGPCAPASE